MIWPRFFFFVQKKQNSENNMVIIDHWRASMFGRRSVWAQEIKLFFKRQKNSLKFITWALDRINISRSFIYHSIANFILFRMTI